MSGEVWLLRLQTHKTAYRGKPRLIAFGPKAQAVLKPFLVVVLCCGASISRASGPSCRDMPCEGDFSRLCLDRVL
jgi:hypothetical protein